MVVGWVVRGGGRTRSQAELGRVKRAVLAGGTPKRNFKFDANWSINKSFKCFTDGIEPETLKSNISKTLFGDFT